MTDRPNKQLIDSEARPEGSREAAKRIDRINRWLHVGGALPADEYARFLAAGITHVVDLREDDEADAQGLQTLGIERRHVPVPNGSPPTTLQLRQVTDWFDQTGETSTIYVHCKGGFGRAATMAVALLIAYGAPLDLAIEKLRSARPEMRLNDEQIAWLRSVEQGFAGNSPA